MNEEMEDAADLEAYAQKAREAFKAGWDEGVARSRLASRSRKFGPKGAEHPGVGVPCPACKIPFKKGDWTGLVPLGPADDAGARLRAREDRPYNAIAIEVHWACMTGEED